MKYKHWIDSTSEVENVVVLSASTLFLASVDEEHIEATGKKLATDANPIEIFGTDGMTIIPLNIIQSAVSRNTDRDVEVRYKTKKEIEEKTVDFESLEDKASFIRLLSKVLPDTLTKKVVQQKALVAAISPLISMLIGLGIIYFFFDKLRWPAIIVGGIWAVGSAYMLVARFSSPPEVTRWSTKGKHLRKTWSGIKTAFSYLVLIAIAIGFYGAASDSYGPNSIVQHINDGDLEVEDIAKFIERGADINVRDQYGETALYTAMYSDEEDLVLELIKQGADVNLVTSEEGSSPLEYALYDSESLAVIRALLEKGALVDFSIDDMTPVEWARYSDNEELATVLLEFGAK